MTTPKDEFRPENIIPINKPLLDSLKCILDLVGEKAWNGPKHFNAILIDRKGFMKMLQVQGQPRPTIRIPVPPKMDIKFNSSSCTIPAVSVCEYVEFWFYRKIGETLEYRE